IRLVVFQDRVADRDAFIANVGPRIIARGGDQLADNILTFVTKTASQSIIGPGTLHSTPPGLWAGLSACASGRIAIMIGRRLPVLLSPRPPAEVKDFTSDMLVDDLVDDTVLSSLLGDHNVVALDVFLDPVERLAGVPDQDV